jgi:hypothetical protein
LKRFSSFSLFVIMMVLSWSAMASAQVQTRIRIIGASNVRSNAPVIFVDPALKDVYRDLGTLFSFNSYRLLQDINLNLTGNRPVDVVVHPGRSLEIALVGEYKNLIELRIRIKRDGATILDTHVRLHAGRTLLIGGPKHGEGTLIFAISARP